MTGHELNLEHHNTSSYSERLTNSFMSDVDIEVAVLAIDSYASTITKEKVISVTRYATYRPFVPITQVFRMRHNKS